MSISAKQTRAALGLLGWNRREFAEQLSMTEASIGQALSGQTEPRPSTQRAMQSVLEKHGIEFLPRDGVALRDDTVRRLNGDDCYLKLLDEVQVEMRHSDEEVLFAFVNHTKSAPEVIAAHNRIQQSNIKVRLLCSSDATDFLYPRHLYRLVPSSEFPPRLVVIYTDRLAVSLWQPEREIVITRNAEMAKTMRALFNGWWQFGTMPEQHHV